MQEVKQYELVSWPNSEIQENFEFDTIASGGTFSFHFKWFNDRWNLWVTLPDGSKRQAGVYPGVVSWSGYSDYGILFNTSLSEIDFNSLMLTELYIVTWQ